jgi:hypothetical protein
LRDPAVKQKIVGVPGWGKFWGAVLAALSGTSGSRS